MHLDGATTAEHTGIVLPAGGLPMLLVQGFVVPKLGRTPLTLLRVGLPLTGVAFRDEVEILDLRSTPFGPHGIPRSSTMDR